MADFTPVGSAMVRVEVFRGSTLAGSVLVAPGVVATASGAADLPGIDAVGWIPPCYLPVIDGIEATREIKRLNPAIKVLMISMLADYASVLKAMKAGADGYLL